jgi:hypothetical protein
MFPADYETSTPVYGMAKTVHVLDCASSVVGNLTLRFEEINYRTA